MSVTYLRWQPGRRRESRVLSPLFANHPAAQFPCLCCGKRLSDGRPVQLLALGPDSDTAREACRDGRWFAALALTVHAECLGTAIAAELPEDGPPEELLAVIQDHARTGGHSPVNLWIGPPGGGSHIATATTHDDAGEIVQALNLASPSDWGSSGGHRVLDDVLVYRDEQLLALAASPAWAQVIACVLNAAVSADPQP